MRILHISNKPAFPLRDGGCIAIKSTLRSFLNHSDLSVYHFTLSTQKHPFQLESYPIYYQENLAIEDFYLNTKTDILGAFIHLIKKKSYHIERFWNKQLSHRLAELLDTGHFDLVFLESIYLLPYLELFKSRNIKVVVRTHNVEHLIWADLSNQASLLKKRYLQKLTQQLQEYELERLQLVDGIVAITTDDLSFFHKKGVHVKGIVIPTGVKSNFPLPNYHLSDFYFLGAMDWQPNKDGVKWLLEEVLNDSSFNPNVHLAGKSLQPADFNHPAVTNHGEVESASTFIAEHGICLIPLRAGSGLKIKLLENMALGKPIITTPEGARGVDITHNKEVIIATSAEEFKQAMEELAADEEKRKSLGTAARAFVIDNFDENKIAQQLVEFIQDI